MPRRAREKSKSGIYHVMLRGTNRQEIFHDDEDRVRFLETLMRYKKESKIKIHGWCLMGNHVHLLLQEGKEELAVTMKRIGVSFAWYYNWKYKISGHLFQDRYGSEKIDSDEQLLAVIRYIHKNPVKAGIVKKPGEWKWSSCRGYYGEDCYHPFLPDSDLILGIFSEDAKVGMIRFIEFNEMECDDEFLDDMVKKRFTDEEAGALIDKVIKGYKIPEIKSLPKVQRDELVAGIKGIKGITQRQMSRILGIPLTLINRA